MRNVRTSLLILLVPAVYNFICFNALIHTDHVDHSIPTAFRILNLVGLVLIVAAIWILGLIAFEFVTSVIHSIFARKSNLDDWTKSLYGILNRTPLFAVLGAVLWMIWIVAFYVIQFGFYEISLPIGIAAHVLAACLYVPLVYRWWRIERSS